MLREDHVPIAIVGIGCRFPGGSQSSEGFWTLLAEGRDTWTEVPEDRFNWRSFFHASPGAPGCMNQRGGHFVQQDLSAFDAEFFGISPLEAKAIDPQQRLLLETTYEASENAGIPLEALKGSDTSVFAATFANDYERMLGKDLDDAARYHFVGTGSATFANRISHVFDLRGPSVTIDTGCSGSIVAVHQACQSLRSSECTLAIAGGAVLTLLPDQMIAMSQQHLFNNEGRCYSFDVRGSGYGRGEGAAVLLLKRLDDAIHEGFRIRAIIRNSAVNQDGKTSGITLPNQAAQERLSQALLRGLDFGPADVQYVEAHATGTVAGDQAEYHAIRNVYCEGRKSSQPLFVGCVKPNIGHLESASGVAGMIKTILSMEKGQMPPNLLFENPKKGIAKDSEFIKFPTALQPWPQAVGPRRAVVNNFGYGGTNAAVVLESFQNQDHQTISPVVQALDFSNAQDTELTKCISSSRWHLFQVSARSESSLRGYLVDLQGWLKSTKEPDLGAIAHTLAQKPMFPWRHAAVADNVMSLVHMLGVIREPERPKVPRTIFVFTGQGAQWPRMGKDLMIHPMYYQSIQASDRVLRNIGASWSLLHELQLCEDASRIHDGKIAQPATTALQIALVVLLRSWNISPAGVLGHSSGEIAAAFAAGALSHEAALTVAYHRGCLSGIAQSKVGALGGMMAVNLCETNALQYIEAINSEERLTIACINSPSSVTISGELNALMKLKATLDAESIFCRRLKTDTAYHSHYMEAVADVYLDKIRNIYSQRPGIEFYSTLTGKKLDSAISPEYWVRNLVSPVIFSTALENLYRSFSTSDHLTFVEIGPHSALLGLLRENLCALPEAVSWADTPTLIRDADGAQSILKVAAILFESGINVNLHKTPNPSCLLTDFPTYHWDRSKGAWHEPRLSRHYRHRHHPPHDLLGLRILTLPDDAPSWRVLLGLKKLPWLGGHRIEGFTVFPATAYLSMVTEAIKQWRGHAADDHNGPKREFRRVSFQRILHIPDPPQNVEICLTLRKNHSSWADFRISSITGDQWQGQCEGQIKMPSDTATGDDHRTSSSSESLKASRVANGRHWSEIVKDYRDTCPERIDGPVLYEVLRTAENTYGPSFALIREAYFSDGRAIARVIIPSPDIQETQSTIHPALVDNFLQLAAFIFANAHHASGIVPSHIKLVRTAPLQFAELSGKEMTIMCELKEVSAQTANFDLSVVIANENAGFEPVLEANGLQLRATGNSRERLAEECGDKVYEMKWDVDPASVTGQDLELLPRDTTLEVGGQDHSLERCNAYLIRYLQHLVFKNPDVRILDIGAVAGGSAIPILQALSPNHLPFAACYHLTDILSDCFDQEMASLANWRNLVAMKMLDIEKDPISQGFEEHSYDFIIVRSIVGAERANLETLRHIRRLMKPDGLLGLIELAGSNKDGRTCSPLLTPEQWNKRLQDACFSGLEVIAHDFPGVAHRAAFLVSRATTSLTPNGYYNDPVIVVSLLGPEHPGRALVTPLFDELNENGCQVIYQVWDTLLIQTSASYVILDSHDTPFLANCTEAQFSKLMQLVTHVSRIVWIALPGRTPLWETNSGGALMTGFARSARSESGSLHLVTIDVQDDLRTSPFCTSKLIAGLIIRSLKQPTASDSVELEYRVQDGKISIPRIVRQNALTRVLEARSNPENLCPSRFYSRERVLQMRVQIPGLLNTLAFVDTEPRSDLDEDELEIEVQAYGVNFKDVWIALGQMGPGDKMIGECAGFVAAVGENLQSEYEVGERVCALIATPFNSRARAKGHVVHRMPDYMSFVEAASIPVAFCTAYYSIVEVARLQPGQRLLIHSGSGALGQASIQVAQHLGAEVFTTVSTPEKHSLLVNSYNISDDHIFSSRSTAFKDDILRMTAGEGVDVALNSLAGDMLQATWECIAEMGTFVELGKLDIRRNSQLDMEQFDKNITFSSVDMISLAKRRPKKVQGVLQAVFRMFGERVLRHVSPVTPLPISEAEQAFRTMQARKHTGKIVLEAGCDAQVPAQKQTLRLDPNGTYIIVGGLGKLGRLLCKHLCSLNAGTIVLLSRQKPEPAERQVLEQRLSSGQTKVSILSCDVSNKQLLIRTARQIAAEFPPVKGIIQNSMVLVDRSLQEMTLGDFRTSIDSKYVGTRNLMEGFKQVPLDFFIFHSSLSGIVGLPGQANYAAGNAYQDHVAQMRPSSCWKKCVSLDIAALIDTHSFSSDKRMQLGRRGILSITNEALFPYLDYAMNPNTTTAGMNQILIGLDLRSASEDNKSFYSRNAIFSHVFATDRYSQHTPLVSSVKQTALEQLASGFQPLAGHSEGFIQTALQEKIASLVAIDYEEVKVSRPIINFGLDSLIAIELKNWISKTFNAPMQTSDILDSPSIATLTMLIMQRIPPPTVPGVDPPREDVNPRVSNSRIELPKLPLQPLPDVLHAFSGSVSALGTDAELLATKQAMEDFQRPKGVGQKLHIRLEELAMKNECWLAKIYNRTFWLHRRGPLRPWTNFFFSHPITEATYTQADKAALLSLVAFEFKKKLDRNEIPPDFSNEEPQCMESLHWIFNACRRPGVGGDDALRFPGNDYIVAMRNGHMFQIPLVRAGKTITRRRLSAIFHAIRKSATADVCWVSVLTTGERNAWADTRRLATDASIANKELFLAIEKSLFIVCLEDGRPQTSEERAHRFLLDDNRNRWNDKMLSLVVCENGASAFWGEHSMIDGSTLDQLGRAVSQAVAHSIPSTTPDAEEVAQGHDFTYLPFHSSPEIDNRIATVRPQYQEGIHSVEFSTLDLPFGEQYLRKHKVSPKGTIQAIISLAVRLHFGYNPASYEAVSMRSFRLGRTDIYQFHTPEMEAFVSAATSTASHLTGSLKLLLHEAVAAHAAGIARTSRGRGWDRQLFALKAVLHDDEPAPKLFDDPLYVGTRPRKVFVTFGGAHMQEWGCIWRDREALWIGVQVFDDSVKLCVLNRMGRASSFCGLADRAAGIVKGILEVK